MALSDTQRKVLRQLGPDGYVIRTHGSGYADQNGLQVSIATVRGLIRARVLIESEGDTLFPGAPSQRLTVSPFMRIQASL